MTPTGRKTSSADPRGPQDGQESDDGNGQEQTSFKDEGFACQACRKKKAKCSRLQPCSQCVKYNTECVYDDRRLKPGMKRGALESLSQRVEMIEKMFLGQGVIWDQMWRHMNQGAQSTQHFSPDSEHRNIKDCATHVQDTLTDLASRHSHDSLDALSTQPAQNPLKRARTDDMGHHSHQNVPINKDGTQDRQYEISQNDFTSSYLPHDLVDDLVDIYFDKVHPWIPMLHVRNFRQEISNPSRRQKQKTVIDAIVSLCIRLSDDARLLDGNHRARIAQACRDRVILRSMESFSVESLQALIICAFETISSSRGPSAWSIVGSMTRTVEHLQLSVEEEDQSFSKNQAGMLLKRMAFLQPCKDWCELEERRRVFWTVFIMDRFCSVATGWNLSLTSADVRRRLPCEGALWEAGQALSTPTPYFGVSDPPSRASGPLPPNSPGTGDQTFLGGFSYSIEATESLSLVTSFFLHQAVDFSRAQDWQMWIMRFKELDLRLLQWKTYLPDQWKEACALNQDGKMDPNLTLAHITHNTAVVLLHQGVAYPSAEWQNTPIRLPSASSADACLAAASEVAIMSAEFLQGTTILISPQFAFCLFVCGRMLAAHETYYGVSLSSIVDSLINNLHEISRRWTGAYSCTDPDNLASKFAVRLSQARRQKNMSLDIRKAAFSATHEREFMPMETEQHTNLALGQGATQAAMAAGASGSVPIMGGSPGLFDTGGSPNGISLAFPPLPLSFEPHHPLYPAIGESSDRDMRTAYSQNAADFENLSFQSSFQPDQIISVFSHHMNNHNISAGENGQIEAGD